MIDDEGDIAAETIRAVLRGCSLLEIFAILGVVLAEGIVEAATSSETDAVCRDLFSEGLRTLVTEFRAEEKES